MTENLEVGRNPRSADTDDAAGTTLDWIAMDVGMKVRSSGKKLGSRLPSSDNFDEM